MEEKWIGYYVYYQDDFNIIIKKALIPLINILNKLNMYEGYFFLRYWENGPHLRFRVKLKNEFEKEICHLIEHILISFLEKNPSKTRLSKEDYYKFTKNFANLEKINKKLPDSILNNYFSRETYVQEKNKYGGLCGVFIAEKIFMKSSSIVINILNKNYSKNVIHFYALIMMFVATKAFKFSLNKQLDFFLYYYNYWSQYLYSQYNKDYTKSLQNLFELKKNVLKDIFLSVHHLQSFNESLVKEWFSTLETAFFEIEANSFNIRNKIFLENKFDLKEYLLMQYIHTHNNRLGILVYEEAILGYLAASTIKNYLIKAR